MKATAFVLLVAAFGVAMNAQNVAVSTSDVTLGLRAGVAEYCLGSFSSSVWALARQQGPDDIGLRLNLKVRYENRRSEKIFLPMAYGGLTRITVAGQNEPSILSDYPIRGKAALRDEKSLLALSRPNDLFWIVTAQTNRPSDVAKFSPKFPPGDGEVDDFVAIPVMARSSGIDLRGKTIQIVISRDFRSIAPEVVEKLNKNWKDYGTVWAQVVESDTLSFRIPDEPLTRNCMVTQ